MSRKVKTRKDRRYQPRVVSPARAEPKAPAKEDFTPEPEKEQLFIPRSNNRTASLQSTNEYVLSDLKQVGIITIILFALLIVTYLIMK